MLTTIELDERECMVLAEELPVLIQVAEDNDQPVTAAVLRDVLAKLLSSTPESNAASA